MPKGDSYLQLQYYLATHGKQKMEMNFNEIEVTLGFELLPSARKHREWWSNSTSHSQAHCWLNAGYRTEMVNLKQERIKFIRC